MIKKEMKKLTEPVVVLPLKSCMNEDLEFRKALFAGKFEKKQHQQKHQAMLDLIKRMERF